MISLGGRTKTDDERPILSSSSMEAATYVDLVNMLLWFISTMWCWTSRKGDLRPVQSTEELTVPEVHMAGAMIEESKQEYDLGKRWSRPPSYSSLSDDESRLLVDKSNMLSGPMGGDSKYKQKASMIDGL